MKRHDLHIHISHSLCLLTLMDVYAPTITSTILCMSWCRCREPFWLVVVGKGRLVIGGGWSVVMPLISWAVVAWRSVSSNVQRSAATDLKTLNMVYVNVHDAGGADGNVNVKGAGVGVGVGAVYGDGQGTQWFYEQKPLSLLGVGGSVHKGDGHQMQFIHASLKNVEMLGREDSEGLQRRWIVWWRLTDREPFFWIERVVLRTTEG